MTRTTTETMTLTVTREVTEHHSSRPMRAAEPVAPNERPSLAKCGTSVAARVAKSRQS